MNPSTGSFTQMDTYGGSLSDPMSLHKYLFANANPVKYRDPSGHAVTGQELLTSMAMSSILAGIEYTLMYSIAIGIDNASGGKTNFQSQYSFEGLIMTMILGAAVGFLGAYFNAILIVPLLTNPNVAKYLILMIIVLVNMTLAGITAGLSDSGCPKWVTGILNGLGNASTSNILSETLKGLGCIDELGQLLGEVPGVSSDVQGSFSAETASHQPSDPSSQQPDDSTSPPFIPTPCPTPSPSAVSTTIQPSREPTIYQNVLVSLYPTPSI